MKSRVWFGLKHKIIAFVKDEASKSNLLTCVISCEVLWLIAPSKLHALGMLSQRHVNTTPTVWRVVGDSEKAWSWFIGAYHVAEDVWERLSRVVAGMHRLENSTRYSSKEQVLPKGPWFFCTTRVCFLPCSLYEFRKISSAYHTEYFLAFKYLTFTSLYKIFKISHLCKIGHQKVLAWL
jgi:hypothetical protein